MHPDHDRETCCDTIRLVPAHSKRHRQRKEQRKWLNILAAGIMVDKDGGSHKEAAKERGQL